MGKNAYKSLINSFLDKPKLEIAWRKGIEDIKKSKFAEADKEFKVVKAEIQRAEKSNSKNTEPKTIEVKGEKINPEAAGEAKAIDFKEKKVENKKSNSEKPKSEKPAQTLKVNKKKSKLKHNKHTEYVKLPFLPESAPSTIKFKGTLFS